jgi:hypothetical protein
LGQKAEDGRPKIPNINLLPIIFLSFLPTGKVTDNQIENLNYKKTLMPRAKGFSNEKGV